MKYFGKKPQYVSAPYVAPPPREQPGPSMDQALHGAELRTGNLDSRIAAIEAEIANYKREMQRSRPGSASHNMYKRRALQAMRQKKSLENRVSMSANAAFNLEQVRDAHQMQQDNQAFVHGLKAANHELRAAQQNIDLDEVEDLRDDMEETLAEVNEVGEVLGRSYDIDNIDQTELEAELDELEQESFNYASSDTLNTPAYLRPSDPYPTPANPSSVQSRPAQSPPYANPQVNRF